MICLHKEKTLTEWVLYSQHIDIPYTTGDLTADAQ